MNFASAIDELLKLGAVSDRQALAALDRLDTLERNKPTKKRVARYAAVGAAAAPVIAGVGHLLEGTKPAKGVRSLVGHAAKGALATGALPLIQQHLDRRGEKKVLKEYLHERGG
jgi:hypothetical protein